MTRVSAVLTATGAVLALALLGDASGTVGAVPTSATGNSPNKAFDITDTPGRSAVLYPGARTVRWIRLSNPANFAISVTTVTATVGTPRTAHGTPARNCPASSVTVGALGVPVTVPPNGSIDTTLPIRMAAGVSDDCKNLTFPLTYSGTATKP